MTQTPETQTPETPPVDTPAPDSTSGDPVVNALNAALDGEHAAIYTYGVVGAHLIDEDRDRASIELVRHRTARDQLVAHVRERDATPSASMPTYTLPFLVEDSTSAADLADHVEERLAGLYADVVTATDGSARADAATALVHTAQARAAWSSTVTAFPGLDDRLDLNQ